MELQSHSSLDDPHPQTALTPTRIWPPFWADFNLNLTQFWPQFAPRGQTRSNLGQNRVEKAVKIGSGMRFSLLISPSSHPLPHTLFPLGIQKVREVCKFLPCAASTSPSQPWQDALWPRGGALDLSFGPIVALSCLFQLRYILPTPEPGAELIPKPGT